MIKTVSCKIIRPANTTTYGVGDNIGINVSVVDITAQAETNLCLIEVGESVIDTILINGDLVTIAGVVGTTEANGDNVITKIDATHFTIPVTFATTYTSGGTIAKLFQASVARLNGGGGSVKSITIITNNTTVSAGGLKLSMYWDPPAAILDNSQDTILAANATKGLIYNSSPTLAVYGAGGDAAHAHDLVEKYFKCKTGSRKLYFQLICNEEYIPASAQIFTITLVVDVD